MNTLDLAERLNRTVKLAMDTGEAESLEHAYEIFRAYSLCIEVGADLARSATLQAALLTAVNAARRCFLGGVHVVGNTGAELLIPWRECRTVREAIGDLKGRLAPYPVSDAPVIVIGDAKPETSSEFRIRATFDGWCGGVIPLDDDVRLSEADEFTPAGVLAGALAVSEAFQFVRGNNAMAGRRPVGLSLWRPEAGPSWLDGKPGGPKLDVLPNRVWLVGLGHLGQAFLWTLGFLPYAIPNDVSLVLQDFDCLAPANDSTSMLTDQSLVGQKKTRAMALWCEERGFRTTIQEREFAGNFRVNENEPSLAVCGVDNEPARAGLEEVGFRRVIEAGLGTGAEEFLAFQLHGFPASKGARSRWGTGTATQAPPPSIEKQAYIDLALAGGDHCGLTTLAGKSVGAAFVGAAVSAIMSAELLRTVTDDQHYEIVDSSLRSLEHIRAEQCKQPSEAFNPGITRAIEGAQTSR